MAYSLYNTIEGLTVTRQDIQEAELLAEKLISAYYPTIDLRDGSALRDIVLRPSATILALVAKGLEKEKEESLIVNVTDDTSEEAVDVLMSNFFIDRKRGSKAQAVVRIKFSSMLPTETVTVTPSAFFSIDNVNRFIPVDTYSLKKNETLFLYQSIDSMYWYGDIVCESEGEGEQFNISGGSEFFFFSIFDPYFVGAECVALTSRSVETETNTSFVARAEEAISTRNLINNISIPARLNEEFNFIKNISTSGYGDYEMIRDYREILTPISPDPIATHLGGHVDVYVRTALTDKVVQVTTDANGIVTFTGHNPIYRISAITDPEVEISDVNINGSIRSSTNLLTPEDVIGFFVEDTNYSVPGAAGTYYEKHYGYSSRQNIRISRSGTPLPANSNFDIKIRYWEDISSIQSFLDDVNTRVICANYVARGYNVVEVVPTFKIIGELPTGEDLEQLRTDILSVCSKYTDSLLPGEQYVHVDLLGKVNEEVAAQYNLSTDSSLKFYLYSGDVGAGALENPTPVNGVITADVVASSIGHDETGPKKVKRMFVFRIRDVNIVGTVV